MIRSTTFDNKYMIVDSQRNIICEDYNLENISKYLQDSNICDYTMIVKHFDIDKRGMVIKEYDNKGNVLNESFLSYYEYGNTVCEMI